MKKLILLALVVCTCSFSFAQEDEKAKSILEKVSETTQAYESLKASFTYIMENKEEKIRDENKGDILLKGNKYQLVMPSYGLEVYSNGTTVWTFMKDANEVSIAEFDEETTELLDPSKIFTIYEEGFSYKFVEEKMSGGKSIYIIDLFPEDEELEYSKMRIEIEKDRMLVVKANMIGREGSDFIVQVDAMKVNEKVSDDIFTFKPENYPDIEIIDLR